MGQRCDCGTATTSLTWCPVFLLEVGSISSLSQLMGSSSKVPPFDSWESLTSHVSGAFWRIPLPQPPISWSCLFPLFLLALRALVLFSHPIPDQSLLLPHSPIPIHFPSQVPSFLSSYDCFLLSPKWDWGILTWALQLVDLFWVLWTVSWLFCTF